MCQPYGYFSGAEVPVKFDHRLARFIDLVVGGAFSVLAFSSDAAGNSSGAATNFGARAPVVGICERRSEGTRVNSTGDTRLLFPCDRMGKSVDAAVQVATRRAGPRDGGWGREG